MAQTTDHKTPTIETLRSRAEYLAVRAGVRASGALMRMESLKTRDAGNPPRIGYTVTKKVGNSVERNRIKRRLRAAVRCHGAGDMRPGHDYVIFSRREVLAAPYDALCADLRTVIAKIHQKLDAPKGADTKKERTPAHG